MFYRSKVTFLFLAGALWSLTGLATEKFSTAAKLLRIGGSFKVESIKKDSDNRFTVIFKSEVPTRGVDTVRLESDHMHVGISEGQVLRISAEVVETNSNVADATQVLLFLPNTRGPMPVWMLSRRAGNLDLRGSKYIEMHAPLSDYIIL